MLEYKENNEPTIILLCGKARSGKSTIGKYLKNKLDKKVIQIQIVSTLKNYVKTYFNWDGSEETKPREILQQLGTDIIRKKLGKETLFIDRTIEDIDIMSHFYDIFVIDDIRLTIEIESIRKHFKNVIVVNVVREIENNELTSEQKKHITETGLDNFKDYDYTIINNKTLNDLKDEVNKFIESSDLQ